MKKTTIRDLDLQGKRVLMRVDFNVPIRNGVVGDETRLVAALPTIQYALAQGASVVLMSHLGRPKGRPDPQFSLRPVSSRLDFLLNRETLFAPDCIGPAAQDLARRLVPGQVLLLENLRFHAGEKNPESEPHFAEALASLGDCYVNDAFGTAHRAHASMVAVAERFEHRAAGFLMAKEIDYFNAALSSPRRPFAAVMGGAKVSDKILVIEHLLSKVDALLIGGAMAYTFLKSQGVEIGKSRVEEDKLGMASQLMSRSKELDVELLLPQDHVCGLEFAEKTAASTTEGPEIDADKLGLDIGPRTLQAYSKSVLKAGTVVWNGPMGVFEWEAFSRGTLGLAEACALSPATTIVGGGDSAAAAKRSGFADKFSHISTGGGASLALLEGKALPGIEILSDA